MLFLDPLVNIQVRIKCVVGALGRRVLLLPRRPLAAATAAFTPPRTEKELLSPLLLNLTREPGGMPLSVVDVLASRLH